jgi:hypothetical protein
MVRICQCIYKTGADCHPISSALRSSGHLVSSSRPNRVIIGQIEDAEGAISGKARLSVLSDVGKCVIQLSKQAIKAFVISEM